MLQRPAYIMSSKYKPVALEESYEWFCDDIDFVPRGNVVIELGYCHYNLQTKQGSKLCSARKSDFIVVKKKVHKKLSRLPHTHT